MILRCSGEQCIATFAVVRSIARDRHVFVLREDTLGAGRQHFNVTVDVLGREPHADLTRVACPAASERRLRTGGVRTGKRMTKRPASSAWPC